MAEIQIENNKNIEKRKGEKDIMIGFLILIPGIIFSIMDFGSIFYGAIVGGIGLMIKGYRNS